MKNACCAAAHVGANGHVFVILFRITSRVHCFLFKNDHMTESAVTFERVSKSWNQTTALHPTDLHLPAGKFSVLLGPSGCGKTTTLRLIAGLEEASAGSITIFGKDVTNLPASQRGVSMVFQNYALFPHMSVSENVVFGLRVRKTPAQEIDARLSRVLDLLSLTKYKDRKPSQLSGGQQQRVALARALVAESRLCLMDEPLSNLDAQLRQEMRHELRALQLKLGLTVVYVTHDQTEAMSMADHVVLLKDGQIQQVATPFEIYQRPGTLFAAQFIGGSRMNVLKLEQGRIAGTDITVPAPAGAVSLGIRPEDLKLGGAINLRLIKQEYMGADVLLHADIGGQTIALRADGKHAINALDHVNLSLSEKYMHWFDNQGRRIS